MADKFNFDDYDYYDLSSLYSALNDHDDHAIETTTKENTADTIIMVTDTVIDLTSTMATTTTGEVITASTTAMLPTPATPATPRLATAALALWMPFYCIVDSRRWNHLVRVQKKVPISDYPATTPRSVRRKGLVIEKSKVPCERVGNTF